MDLFSSSALPLTSVTFYMGGIKFLFYLGVQVKMSEREILPLLPNYDKLRAKGASASSVLSFLY